MRKKLWIVLITALFICYTTNVAFADYVLDKNYNEISIPETYKVNSIIKNLGDAGFMDNPQDVFIDDMDNIYIADTGNNRILKLNSEGIIQRIFDQADGLPFNSPQGVFVDKDGSIWVGDTGNQRVATLHSDGTDRKVYVKPDSPLLGESFTFDPSKIYVNSVGYIYVLKGTTLMSIDENNNFRGFIGANKVNYSFSRVLIRMFGTQTQKDRISKPEPDAYTNFTIGKDGMIYGTVVSSRNGEQIRKLTPVGNNVYPSAPFDHYGEISIKDGIAVDPSLVDIAVADNGIITVVEKNNCKIYQYDQVGNLITVFGGIGTTKGQFLVPSAIDIDSQGNLFLLDSSTGILQKYEPTEFIQLIHQSVFLEEEGKYDEAMDYWEKVLKIDDNYSLVHKGIGKLDYKKENWKDSFNRYYAADDKIGYSKAYKEYRHQTFRENFFIITLIVVVLLFVVVTVFVKIKRKADQIAHDVEYNDRGGC